LAKLYETESLSGKQRENQPAISKPAKIKNFKMTTSVMIAPVWKKKRRRQISVSLQGKWRTLINTYQPRTKKIYLGYSGNENL
jgi:hypothetical protein